jgi:hypothetical protein
LSDSNHAFPPRPERQHPNATASKEADPRKTKPMQLTKTQVDALIKRKIQILNEDFPINEILEKLNFRTFVQIDEILGASFWDEYTIMSAFMSDEDQINYLRKIHKLVESYVLHAVKAQLLARFEATM